MRMPHPLLVALCLFVAAVTTGEAQFVVPPAGEVSSAMLRFDAKASVGDFTGTTSTATGSYAGGPELRNVTGHVEAPVATLRTQNDGRDRHLREALAADSFPVIRFDVASVTPGVSSGDTLAVVLAGSISVHGVTRPREVPATLLRSAGGFRLLATFPMSFKEFGIRKHLSKFLGIVKVGDDFTVTVDIGFVAAAHAP